MTDEELAKIKAHLNSVVDVPADALGIIRVWHDTAFAFARDAADLLAEVERLRPLVRALAELDLEYTDEHLEYYCPACRAFVSADWWSNRKPYGMTGHDWALHRMKHEADCPVIKARAVIDTGPLAGAESD